eukprot:826039-Pleurochrysis_carterae.AAC.1
MHIVYEFITASSSAKLAWSEARRRLSFSHDDYILHRGRIFYKAINGLRLAYHRLLPLGGHRGADTVCRKLAQFYHWEGMKGGCDEFVKRCEVCNAQATASLPDVRSHSLTEPPHPFHTIYIHHKTAMPRSLDNEFHYILVVVCGLTSFTIANPCTRHFCRYDAQGARRKGVYHSHHSPCTQERQWPT